MFWIAIVYLGIGILVTAVTTQVFTPPDNDDDLLLVTFGIFAFWPVIVLTACFYSLRRIFGLTKLIPAFTRAYLKFLKQMGTDIKGE